MKALLRTAIALAIVCGGNAEATVIYDNGPVVNEDYQHLTNAYGPEGQVTNDRFNFGDANEFIVAGSTWNVNRIDIYSAYYDRGLTAQLWIQSVNWSIVAGDPNTGQVVASGQTAPSDYFVAGYLNLTNGVGGPQVTFNAYTPILDVGLDIPDVTLGAGSYVLEYTTTSGQVEFTPFITGAVNTNSYYHDRRQNIYIPNNSPDEAFPFLLSGSVIAAVPEPATNALMLFGLAGLGLTRIRRLRSTPKPTLQAAFDPRSVS